MFCAQCGKPFLDDVKFCSSCGAPVDTSVDAAGEIEPLLWRRGNRPHPPSPNLPAQATLVKRVRSRLFGPRVR